MNSPKKTGIGMFIASWVILLALMTWYFGLREQKRYNPNQNPDSVNGEIVLEKNTFGQYILSGKINSFPVTFLVDTGANTVVVGSQVAQQTGLTHGRPVSVVTASGYTTAWQTELDSLEIGHIRLNHIAALINPDMPADEVLLGMSALQHINFRQENHTLILHY